MVAKSNRPEVQRVRMLGGKSMSKEGGRLKSEATKDQPVDHHAATQP